MAGIQDGMWACKSMAGMQVCVHVGLYGRYVGEGLLVAPVRRRLPDDARKTSRRVPSMGSGTYVRTYYACIHVGLRDVHACMHSCV